MILALPLGLAGEDAKGSPRVTPTVRLVQRCGPAVVSLRCVRSVHPNGAVVFELGSGSVIHSSGLILTNQHVVRHSHEGEAIFHDGSVRRYEVVAGFAPEDLAIIRVATDKPLPTLEFGRSHDLLLGEPTIVIGNPGGLVHTISTGIVSGLARMTNSPGGPLPGAIQTNAAINGGNSGGPLINALGQLIGVVHAKQNGVEGIGFAIPVDRVRQMIPKILSVEERYGFRFGASTDVLAEHAIVANVDQKSPAEKLGLLPRDEIRKVGGLTIRNGVDISFALLGRKAGEEIDVEWKRVSDGKVATAKIRLGEYPYSPPVSDEGKEQGLAYDVVEGQWNRLPDLGTVRVVETGKINKLAVPLSRVGKEDFAVRITGFVKVPEDGFYTIYSGSDDGSRVWIGGKLIVDNDGLHAHVEAAGLVRLTAGLHPIDVRMFERGGEESLKVSWEGPGLKKEEIPPRALFREKQKK